MKESMNKIRDAFEGIHADTQMKETTKQFLAEKYEERQKKFFRPVFKRAMPVVCVLLLFLIGAICERSGRIFVDSGSGCLCEY